MTVRAIAELDITPVLNRELMTASRRVSLWGNRGFIAGAVLAIVLVTFAARSYWDGGHDSPARTTRVALQSFLWIVLFRGFLIMGVGTAGAAPSIAGEKERRTLDFHVQKSGGQHRKAILVIGHKCPHPANRRKRSVIGYGVVAGAR